MGLTRQEIETGSTEPKLKADPVAARDFHFGQTIAFLQYPAPRIFWKPAGMFSRILRATYKQSLATAASADER